MTTHSPLVELTANELRERIGTREVSPVELLEACIERIEAINPHINAITATCYDRARTEALLADSEGLGDDPGLEAFLKQAAKGSLAALGSGGKDIGPTDFRKWRRNGAFLA